MADIRLPISSALPVWMPKNKTYRQHLVNARKYQRALNAKTQILQKPIDNTW
jgi:hypothetical protein